jgi:phage-related protein
MHDIIFYHDKNGYEPVKAYIDDLSNRQDKNSRIKFNKIVQYIHLLAEKGLAVGEPYIKHIDGDIWELRPSRDRILFVAWIDDAFLILHHFIKKTQKTPIREIEKAKSELDDFRKRELYYDF